MGIIHNNSHPFLQIPAEVTAQILMFCEGNLTGKISRISKLFLNFEQQETIWRARVISVLGLETGKQFFDTYKSWKAAYINFFQMNKEGEVISPTELVDHQGVNLKGSFLNGKLHGQGEKTFDDGKTWIGQFRNGEFIKGEKIFDGGEMVLNFDIDNPPDSLPISALQAFIREQVGLDDKLNGSGKIIFISGGIYEGIFLNGRLNGLGKISYPEGCIVEGIFRDDKLNGQGKISYPNGVMIEGIFENDELNGQGKINYSEGNIVEGIFKDGKLNGKGKIQYSNGEVLRAIFKDDKPQGFYVIDYPDGKSCAYWAE